jgi:cytochrome c5
VKQVVAVIALFVAGLVFADRVPPGTNDEISARLKPVGSLCKVGEACGASAAVASGGAARSGEQVYNQFCFVCHTAGVSGAPKLKDVAEWTPRLAKGDDALWKSMTSGLNAMPPKGTCMNCSDDELHAAMAYMSKP